MGRMVLQGTVPKLARKVLGGAYRIQFQADGSTPKLRKALEDLRGVNHVSCRREVRIEAQKDIRADAAEAVIKAAGRLQSLNVDLIASDDIYTGGTLQRSAMNCSTRRHQKA